MRAYRFRLYPSSAQRRYLTQCMAAARVMWNVLLAEHERRLKHGRTFSGRTPWLRERSKDKELDGYQLIRAMRADQMWMNEVPAVILQAVLMDFFKAIKNWREGRARPPRRKRFGSVKSIAVRSNIVVERGYIKLPRGPGVTVDPIIPYRMHRRMRGRPMSYTITQEGRHWYISILCDLEVEATAHRHPGTRVVVHRNVRNRVMLYDGERFVEEPAMTRLLQLERLYDQRRARLDRRKKDRRSKNYRKELERIWQLRARAKWMRADATKQVAHRLASSFETVVIEDYDVSRMTRSSKTRGHEPDEAYDRAGLNRAVLNHAWYALKIAVEVKTQEYGGALVVESAVNITDKCSACGALTETPLGQSTYRCHACDYREDRDHNACKNLWGRTSGGPPESACGGGGASPPDETGRADGDVAHAAQSAVLMQHASGPAAPQEAGSLAPTITSDTRQLRGLDTVEARSRRLRGRLARKRSKEPKDAGRLRPGSSEQRSVDA